MLHCYLVLTCIIARYTLINFLSAVIGWSYRFTLGIIPPKSTITSVYTNTKLPLFAYQRGKYIRLSFTVDRWTPDQLWNKAKTLHELTESTKDISSYNETNWTQRLTSSRTQKWLTKQVTTTWHPLFKLNYTQWPNQSKAKWIIRNDGPSCLVEETNYGLTQGIAVRTRLINGTLMWLCPLINDSSNFPNNSVCVCVCVLDWTFHSVNYEQGLWDGFVRPSAYSP